MSAGQCVKRRYGCCRCVGIDLVDMLRWNDACALQANRGAGDRRPSNELQHRDIQFFPLEAFENGRGAGRQGYAKPLATNRVDSQNIRSSVK